MIIPYTLDQLDNLEDDELEISSLINSSLISSSEFISK